MSLITWNRLFDITSRQLRIARERGDLVSVITLRLRLDALLLLPVA